MLALAGVKAQRCDQKDAVRQKGLQGALCGSPPPIHPGVFWQCLKAETRISGRRRKEELQGL